MSNVSICPKRLQAYKERLVSKGLDPTTAERRAEEILAIAQKTLAKGDVSSGGEFVGGFEGCVKHMMETKGLPEENARKLCAYIGRQSGKIP